MNGERTISARAGEVVQPDRFATFKGAAKAWFPFLISFAPFQYEICMLSASLALPSQNNGNPWRIMFPPLRETWGYIKNIVHFVQRIPPTTSTNAVILQEMIALSCVMALAILNSHNFGGEKCYSVYVEPDPLSPVVKKDLAAFMRTSKTKYIYVASYLALPIVYNYTLSLLRATSQLVLSKGLPLYFNFPGSGLALESAEFRACGPSWRGYLGIVPCIMVMYMSEYLVYEFMAVTSVPISLFRWSCNLFNIATSLTYPERKRRPMNKTKRVIRAILHHLATILDEAALGAAILIFAWPFRTLLVRCVWAHQDNALGWMDAAKQIYSVDGIAGFWRGVGIGLISKTAVVVVSNCVDRLLKTMWGEE